MLGWWQCEWNDMDTFKISSVISEGWVPGKQSVMTWCTVVHLSQGQVGWRWPCAEIIHNTAVQTHFPITPLGSLDLPFFLQAVLSQLWGRRVADVPGIAVVRVELESTSSLITLCLNCSVTQGRVQKLAFEKKPLCFQFELTWSLFLCGNEIY